MNTCSNCQKEYGEDVNLFRSEDGRHQFCIKCHVLYGKNRSGFAFMIGDDVFLNGFHPKTEGRIFIIKELFIYEPCESGRLAYLIDKETGRPLKQMLDVNWLIVHVQIPEPVNK